MSVVGGIYSGRGKENSAIPRVRFTEAVPGVVSGNQNLERISTSHVERQEPHEADADEAANAPKELILEKDRSHRAAVALHFAL